MARWSCKTRCGLAQTRGPPRGKVAGMQLEFHQLARHWEHLRVRRSDRHRRLLASLAASGQQTPIVVVAGKEQERYLVIDGYKRIAALEQNFASAGARWKFSSASIVMDYVLSSSTE
jgi:hypothetical protein